MAYMAGAPQPQSAYLVVDGSLVYELPPHTALTIGRLDTNDVMLDDYKVSREHAVVKYNGKNAVIIDLASTHGTLLNGERVTKVDVDYGTDFQIVSHQLRFTDRKSDIGALASEGSPTVVSSFRARSLDRRVKFFGGLNEFCLLTLVQFLSQEKQSGLLLLEIGQVLGPRIYFQNGEITHVIDGDELGELLTAEVHEHPLFFYFHHESEFPARTIHQPTPNYLIELVHGVDLKKNVIRAAARVPTPANSSNSETGRIQLPSVNNWG
jgi:pSer/pThr/pTyr-binding forkhead associated (FHA) protein